MLVGDFSGITVMWECSPADEARRQKLLEKLDEIKQRFELEVKPYQDELASIYNRSVPKIRVI
jgi:restriction endonuclease S subunit